MSDVSSKQLLLKVLEHATDGSFLVLVARFSSNRCSSDTSLFSKTYF